MPLDRILATALKIADEEGVEALSMRTLAQRLDSGTATLYRHFSGRADLLAQVADRLFGEVELDAADFTATDWQQACRAVAHAMFRTLSRHPGAARLFLERVPVGPNAMAQREAGLAFLLQAGFPPDLAVRSYATLARFVLGFAIQLGEQTGAGRSEDPLAVAVRELDPADYPATTAVADWLPVPLADEFTFGLDLIIAGLGQALTAARQRPS